MPLSSILEAAGLRVVGRASTPDELERLLRVTRPGVVVFDAEMSVEAVAATREAEPRIGIVAVWPAGIESEVVDAVVRPSGARRDLAGAVRRVTPAPAMPRRWASSPAAAAVGAAGVVRTAPPRRGGVELAVAAVLTFLLVTSAIVLRNGGGGGGTIAGGPGDVLAPSSPTGGQVSPPDGPTDGSSGSATIAVAELGPVSPDGGGQGQGGGTGQGEGPAQGPDGPGTGGQEVTARERACRSAAGLGMHETVGAGDGVQLQHMFQRCVTTDAPGPLRALTKISDHAGPGPHHGSGHGSGEGGSGDHGHGHAYGHDGDHGHGHGHAYGHDEDHGHGSDHGHGHAYGHDH